MSGVRKVIDAAARAGEVQARNQVHNLKAEIKRLERAIVQANARAEIVSGLKAGAKSPRPVKHARNLHRRNATWVGLYSDWHVEEVVKSEKVLGLNAYTPEIAAARIKRLGEAQIWAIEHHRTSFEIRELLISLNGDFLSGYIHEELMEGNAMSPVQTLLWLQEHISQSIIEPALALPGIERIRFMCIPGNHGRTTHKIRVATGAENSYEWLMYQQLARTYALNKRLEWHIAAGEFAHINVTGVDLGFTHGHAVTYGGGVGGITIPIKRAIPRWDSFQKADVWNVSHFHQYHDLPSLVVNGSLIGVAPYGMRVGGMEIPAQASYLIDQKRRTKCMSTTLWPVGSDFGRVGK